MVGMSPYEDEELELSEDLSQGSIRSTSAEQEQGLLGSWKERDGEEEAALVPTRRRPWSWMVYGAIAAAITMSLLISIGFVLGLGHAPNIHNQSAASDETSATAKGQTSGPTDIQTNDYMLPSNWDFSAAPQRREYQWTIRDQLHNPDGVYRPMMLVNNQFPGPLVEVNQGDTIVVHVNNQAVNATSIHWHGIYQNGTPHMDGTVGITQCPIAPGEKFTYKFTVDDQSGTYWWHAHHGVQSSDGVHGPLIIHGKHEKTLQQIQYATDRVVLLADHYHELSSALLWQYLKPDMENAEPVPESGLINGRGIRGCDDYPERQCDNTTSNLGPIVFDLTPGQSHRLRVINVGALAEFQVQIDEHELAVTEVDGTDVNPVNYHRININPAQRYSVIVNTTVATADSFWFRARMITTCFTDPPTTLQPDVLGIVRYGSRTSHMTDSPTSVDWEEQLQQECRDMNTTDLVPTQVIAAPGEADAFFYFRANFQIGWYRLSRGFFDDSTWRPNAQSPSLLRAIDGISTQNTSFAAPAALGRDGSSANAYINAAAFDISHEMVMQTTGIQTIDILVSNFDDGNHPLHLHGYKYFVLAQGHGSPPMKSVLDGMTRDNIQPLYDDLDLSNPLRRDTASVEAFGWILLRLVADNPGAWAFHCHVSWHTEAGLLMQFLTRSDELAGMETPRANLDLCVAQGLSKGMGPNDEDYRDLAR